MDRLKSFTKDHSLGTYVGLAFTLTWPAMALWLASGREDIPWFTFGPLLAALVITAQVGGFTGLKELLSRQVRWRVGLGWYAAAIGLPIALELATVALNVALGADAPAWERVRPWPSMLSMILIYTLFSGPLGEELGWRGFALPRLLERFADHRYGALAASLILGVIHAAWHLPLLLGGEQDLPSLLGPIAAAVVFTWLFQNARGSVLIAVMFHAAVQNSGRFLSPVFTGADADQLHWLKLVVWAIAAVVVVLVAGPAQLAHTQRASAASSSQPTAAL